MKFASSRSQFSVLVASTVPGTEQGRLVQATGDEDERLLTRQLRSPRRFCDLGRPKHAGAGRGHRHPPSTCPGSPDTPLRGPRLPTAGRIERPQSQRGLAALPAPPRGRAPLPRPAANPEPRAGPDSQGCGPGRCRHRAARAGAPGCLGARGSPEREDGDPSAERNALSHCSASPLPQDGPSGVAGVSSPWVLEGAKPGTQRAEEDGEPLWLLSRGISAIITVGPDGESLSRLPSPQPPCKRPGSPASEDEREVEATPSLRGSAHLASAVPCAPVWPCRQRGPGGGGRRTPDPLTPPSPPPPTPTPRAPPRAGRAWLGPVLGREGHPASPM
ncbi:vegetative cell wall protein gp1-like [Vulpes lagopus]|uniref:vegetative cell wall protein gp1-like n=1 Tax=Vulpes lagopus TaxID=494514 RepID=UPI001BC97BD7|nr:vegetative cell wall protein gp1-like [Vulpes lagopus]